MSIACPTCGSTVVREIVWGLVTEPIMGRDVEYGGCAIEVVEGEPGPRTHRCLACGDSFFGDTVDAVSETGLTDRFGEAAAWASELHIDHLRKGTTIPYVSHLFAVASLVLEDGGDEDEAIAALLHDAVEDGKTDLDTIAAQFGDSVAAIVDACSDTDTIPKPPWRERKERYIAHVRDPHTSEAALRVSNADKVHNARAILADYTELGDALWTRFNADARSADAQLWYYRQLSDAFLERRPTSRLAHELARLVDELETRICG
ncbi:MAG TPA: HD domain-containing protein [Acidimicrobiales bacterium]|nr:HD domain-containing protein [Acidimicrobiales bacterium]